MSCGGIKQGEDAPWPPEETGLHQHCGTKPYTMGRVEARAPPNLLPALISGLRLVMTKLNAADPKKDQSPFTAVLVKQSASSPQFQK